MSEPDALHPRLRDPALLARLRRVWAESACLRVESVLAPGFAEELAQACWSLPYAPHHRHDAQRRCFFFRCQLPDSAAPTRPVPLVRALRLVAHELPRLARAISGEALRSPSGAGLTVCRFRKGCYLDLHDDADAEGTLAFVLGLTPAPWPAEEGGHLELFAEDGQTLRERRPPGFDTLDLYAVRPGESWHRVPLLVEPRERLTIRGWLRAEGA